MTGVCNHSSRRSLRETIFLQHPYDRHIEFWPLLDRLSCTPHIFCIYGLQILIFALEYASCQQMKDLRLLLSCHVSAAPTMRTVGRDRIAVTDIVSADMIWYDAVCAVQYMPNTRSVSLFHSNDLLQCYAVSSVVMECTELCCIDVR